MRLYGLLWLLLGPLLLAQPTIEELEHDGSIRGYVEFVPSSYDSETPMPLVLNLHGYTSNGIAQTAYSLLHNVAEEEGFIVVAPDGLLDDQGITHWNAGWGSDVDDLGFLEFLIDELSVKYNIDQNRIYSTGMSNGGYMSYSLACFLNHRIAAIASVTGSMVQPHLNGLCQPERPVPVLQFHGTDDLTVPYEGSELFSAGIDDVMAFWASNNGCNETPEITLLPDVVPFETDSSTVEHHVFACETGADVELYKIYGGGHTWPGALISIGNGATTLDIDASQLIWEFFERYTLDGFASSISEIENLETVYPNPFTDVLNIQMQSEGVYRLVITDLSGKEIYRGLSTNTAIATNEWSNGIYMIQFFNENGEHVFSRKALKLPK